MCEKKVRKYSYIIRQFTEFLLVYLSQVFSCPVTNSNIVVIAVQLLLLIVTVTCYVHRLQISI